MVKNLIWDFDGTLVDSYPQIIINIEKTLNIYNIDYDICYLQKYIKEKSVKNYFEILSKSNQEHFTNMWDTYSSLAKDNWEDIKLYKNIKKLLIKLHENQIKNFIYTHRDETTINVLKMYELENYFEEVVTSNNNFKRKPHSEGVDYILNKYKISKDDVFYVGDRYIDFECAKAANINCILIRTDKKYMNNTIFNIKDEEEILELIKK